MNDFFEYSLYSCVMLSIASYMLGVALKKRFKLNIFNPLLIAIVISIAVLVVADIDYEVYNKSASVLSFFLTPATVCLAIPLYEKWDILKENAKAVIAGILSGVITSLATVFVLAKIMRLDKNEFVTMLPKSITTAIGMDLSKELGGYVTITVAVIVITGVLGNMFGEILCRLFGIRENISKGLALGTSAHAIGTSKAMEIDELAGAMGGLSIAVAGFMTVVLANVFVWIY